MLQRSATVFTVFIDVGKLHWPAVHYIHICELDCNPGDESLCMIEESLKTVFNNASLYNE